MRERKNDSSGNQTSIRCSFLVRDDLNELALELWRSAHNGRGKRWWTHTGPPHAYEVVAWLIRQYDKEKARQERYQQKRKNGKAKGDQAGIESQTAAGENRSADDEGPSNGNRSEQFLDGLGRDVETSLAE